MNHDRRNRQKLNKRRAKAAKEPDPVEALPETQEGDGGEVLRPSEILAYRAAVANEWPITDEIRAVVIETMANVVRNGRTSLRSKLSASKVLTTADTINTKREATAKGKRPPVTNTLIVNLEALSPDELRQLREIRQRLAGIAGTGD